MCRPHWQAAADARIQLEGDSRLAAVRLYREGLRLLDLAIECAPPPPPPPRAALPAFAPRPAPHARGGRGVPSRADSG